MSDMRRCCNKRWKSAHIAKALLAVTTLLLLTSGCAAGYLGDAPVVYLADSSDTVIAPDQDSSSPTINIYSKSGIGSGGFWLLGNEPPVDLTLRLHLRGLEQLTFVFGEYVVSASVSSHGEQTVSETLSTASKAEMPITPDSPYWVEITPIESVGQTTYFDVKPPVVFYDGWQSFKLTWIDFYR